MEKVRLSGHKEQTRQSALKPTTVPSRVVIPLNQHYGATCDSLVAVGDEVVAGQLIGSLEKGLASPVHASLSGKVVSIENYPHPTLGTAPAVVIESDGEDIKSPLERKEPLSRAEVLALSPAELKKRIFAAGIVGLGGAAFPTHVKLSPPKPVRHFIVNGVECEPYLTADFRLMLEKSQEIILGMEVALRILGLDSGIIAIEDNNPEAAAVFKELLNNSNHSVAVVPTAYPQGGEKQLIRSLLNKEVPSGGLPFDIGVVVQNVSTVYAIYEAVYRNKPLYERAITVTGSCLARPGNFLVRIGTTLEDLLAECGPLKEEPAKIIFGGPMMGIAQCTFDVPIIKSTGGVLCFSRDEVFEREDRVCCRCGRCVDVCPAGIVPAFICMAAERDKFSMAQEYDIFDCIECGLCSYICPARRDLVGLIRYAKSRLKKK